MIVNISRLNGVYQMRRYFLNEKAFVIIQKHSREGMFLWIGLKN